MATYLLAQVQLSNQHTVLDIDTMFHYSRFNDIAEQLKNRNFSYFQTNFAFEHSGRIINTLYGPSWSKSAKTTNLPIILYHQSALKVNGKLIHPKLNLIGTPILKTRKQQNYVILQFITPAWFKSY